MEIIRIDREFLAAPTSVDPIRDALAAKLLGIGGERVIWLEPEMHAGLIVNAGRLFPLKIKMRRGERNLCHTNSAGIWGQDTETCQLITGFALKKNIWRCHSWVVSGNTLIETTARNEQYFGVVLSPTEAARFWFHEYLLTQTDELANPTAEFQKRFEQPLAMLASDQEFQQKLKSIRDQSPAPSFPAAAATTCEEAPIHELEWSVLHRYAQNRG